PIAGKGFVLVDDLRDGRRGNRTVIALCVFAINLFRGSVFVGARPGDLCHVGHLRVDGISQPPGEAIETLEVGRARIPSLDGFREVQVIRIVVFRTAAVPFQPWAPPVFAGAINGSVLATSGVFGNGGAD